LVGTAWPAVGTDDAPLRTGNVPLGRVSAPQQSAGRPVESEGATLKRGKLPVVTDSAPAPTGIAVLRSAWLSFLNLEGLVQAGLFEDSIGRMAGLDRGVNWKMLLTDW